MKKILLITLFPFFTYAQIQIGQDIDGEAAGDFSGDSVSLSSNGSIVAIEAGFNDGNGMNSGHVRVFENQGGNWIQIGDDIDGEAAGDAFGGVSISSDGNIVAIGAANNAGNEVNSGHVRVFENQNGNWIQIGDDIDGEAENDLFGSSVSLSSDGNIVAIGGSLNDDNGMNSGHVRIFENQDGSWIQIGDDIDGESPDDRSGASISLSDNGNIVAITAFLNDGNGMNSGHVRIFENQDGNWIQIGDDIDGEAAGDTSGNGVSLSSDGNIVAVGAVHNTNNGVISGHVRVFENINGTWIQIGNDIDGEAENDQAGSCVSLSSDGNIIAVGAILNDGNGENSGHVRIFKNQNGNWIQIGDDIDGEAAGDFSSVGMSLSSDGTVIAIGASNNSDNGDDSGHVRVYDLSALLATEETTLSDFNMYPNPATTFVAIEVGEGVVLEETNIYNNLGQHIKTTNTNFVNTTELSQGIYVVEIITTQGKFSRKLIIE